MITSTHALVAEAERADYPRRLELLETAARKAVRSGDTARMRHALEELDRFYWSIALDQPSFWIDCFVHIEETLAPGSVAEAEPLLQQGRQAIADEDDEMLRRTCRELWELLSPREQAATGLKDIGIHV